MNSEKKIDTIDNNEYKIFVGNVPYDCTYDEFESCFKNIPGFIRADIAKIYKTNTSRGFGFVSFKTLQDAENLKERYDIVLKDRLLRFTTYKNDTERELLKNYNNYVVVNSIPSGKNKDWIKNGFREYEPIGKYFINTNYDTGELKNNAVIEILDDVKYNNLLIKKTHNIKNINLEISKYKSTNIWR